MADTVRTKIRKALQDVISNRITEANGYNNNYRTGVLPKSPEEFIELPFVNLTYGREDAANKNLGSQLVTGGNKQLLHNSLTIYLDIWDSNLDEPNQAQENILEDFQKYFGINYSLPSVDDATVGTVFNMIYSGSEPFAMSINRPNCGITIEFKIWYRQSLINPEVQG